MVSAMPMPVEAVPAVSMPQEGLDAFLSASLPSRGGSSSSGDALSSLLGPPSGPLPPPRARQQPRRPQVLRSISDKIESAGQEHVLVQRSSACATTFREPRASLSLSLSAPLRPAQREREDLKAVLAHCAREALDPATHALRVNHKLQSLREDEQPLYAQLHHAQPHNALTRVSQHNEDAFRSAHFLLRTKAATAAYLLQSNRRNTLHEFCWPVPLLREIEGVERLFQLRKKETVQDFTTRNGCERVQEERQQYLQDDVRHFTTDCRANYLLWSENFHVVPSRRYEDTAFRAPSACTQSLAVSAINASGKIQKSLQRLRVDDLLYSKLEDAKDPSLPFYRPIKRMRISEENTVRRSLGRDTLARHFEAMTDASVHMVLNFLQPFMEIAANLSSSAPANVETSSSPSSSSPAMPAPLPNSLTIQKKEGHNARSVSVKEKKRRLRIKVKLSQADLQFLERERALKRARQEGREKHLEHRWVPTISALKKDHTKLTKISLVEMIRVRREREKKRLPPPQITWEHVLLAVQTLADDLQNENRLSFQVNPRLPSVRLTPAVVQRVQNRLLALYAQPAVASVSKEEPEILARNGRDLLKDP